MRKFNILLILLLAISLVPFGGVAVAQDGGEDEVDVVVDILIPRLEEYNENLPDHYGFLGLDELLETMAEDEDIFFLDVREEFEVEDFGTIEGAINVPLRTLGENIDLLPADLDTTIVVICKGGDRATIGMFVLQVLGYDNAKLLKGGFTAWADEGLPIAEEAAEAEASEISEDIDPLLLEFVADHLANLPEGWGLIQPDALFEEMFETMPDLILDVRSEEEWMDPGFIEDAEWLWINDFVAGYEELLPEDLETNIVVYCASAYRGGVVATMLRMLGYENVRNMKGGLNAWIAAELPVEQPE